MKRKIIVSLIVIFLFALATILHGDGSNTSPDIMRFGFPLPIQETYTGKSFDPHLQRKTFYISNLIGDLIVLGLTICVSNLVITTWIRRSNAN